MTAPPRLFEHILRILSSGAEREAVLGDVAEEFVHLARQSGERVARRWYRREVLFSIAPIVGLRITRRFKRLRARFWQVLHSPRASFMDDFYLDVRFALRSIAKRPGFALAAILTLAIGIGANTAIFSLVNGVFFKGVPGVEERGLVNVGRVLNAQYYDMSWPVVDHLAQNSASLEALATIVLAPMALGTGREGPAVHLSAAVSSNFFATLGLTPQRGRFFFDGEDFPTAADVSVISHGLWQSKFNGDEAVIGATLTVNGQATRVVGVAPRGFNGPAVGVRLDAYVPVGLEVPGLPQVTSLAQWNTAQLEVIGRMRNGWSPSAASEEVSALATRFIADVSNREAGEDSYIARVEPWSPVPPTIRVGVTIFFSILMSVVAILLGMACLNVTNMLLSRSAERRSELSIRLAMGASRNRLIRQLLTETGVLFFLSLVGGILLAVWASRLLLSFQPPLPPGFVIDLDVGIDWRVLFFCTTLSGLACLVFGSAPAFRATRPDLVAVMRSTSGSTGERTRIRSMMLGLQMAGTLVLLVGAGLFMKALRNLESLDPGWNAHGVYVAEFDVDLVGMSEERGAIFFDELLQRVRGVPGIRSASLAAKLPLAGSSSFGQVNVRGLEAPADQYGFDASLNRVSDGYFQSVDLDLVQGGDFGQQLSSDGPVAVVNQTMATRLWPDQSPIGESFYIGTVATGTPVEVVGVVEDAKYRRLVEDPRSFYYVSFRQFFNSRMVLHIQVADALVDDLAKNLRAIVGDMAPSLAMPELRGLESTLGVFVLPQRLGAFVAGAMGGVGLLLGIVGVYGVTSFLIAHRRREIGVRIALGADEGRVLRGMMARGLVAPLSGMCAGLVMAGVLAGLTGRFLGLVRPIDPLTFATVVGILASVAVVATYLPTRRAMRADPVAALRSE